MLTTTVHFFYKEVISSSTYLRGVTLNDIEEKMLTFYMIYMQISYNIYDKLWVTL